MIYKHIAEVVNDTYDDILGKERFDAEGNPLEPFQLADDLSNVVEVGKKIAEVTADNYDTYVKKLIDRIGRVMFRANKIGLKHLPLYKDSWEYGSIAQKIRVEVPKSIEDNTFDLAGYTGEDVFTLSLPTASQKFFNNSTTFSTKISLPKVQAKSAFTSQNQLSQFVALIENTIKQNLAIKLLGLEYKTVVNLIAEKFKEGNKNCLVNLYAEYVDETGDKSVPVSQFLTNEKCLRFSNKKINMCRDLLEKPSVIYNSAGYTNVSQLDEQQLLLITDYERALGTYLYSVNRHNEFVKLENFATVPYWQNGGDDDSYDYRSTIYAIPASEGNVPSGEDTRVKIYQDNVLGVLYDYRAAAVNCAHSDVESINVPDVRMMNYWYFNDANYCTDIDENILVFYLDEYRCEGKLKTEPASMDGYYTYTDGEYAPAGDYNANTIYYTKVIA